jgi:hypothetical protein
MFLISLSKRWDYIHGQKLQSATLKIPVSWDVITGANGYQSFRALYWMLLHPRKQ